MGDPVEATPVEMVPATTIEGAPFPLDSFRDAARELRRPFTENAVKFKLQTSWKDGRGGLVVSFIDARLVEERLNLVVPHLWSDNYDAIGGSKAMWCHLTVDGITRSDVGSGYEGKGLVSDALKRAAVKFGVGVSLYAIPSVTVTLDDGHVRVGERWDKRQSKKVPTAILTPNGLTHCRTLYSLWLDTIGKKAFGPPLDHGDVENAVGDVEAETDLADSAPEADDQPEKLTDAKATALIEAAEKLYDALPKEAKKKRPPAAFRRELAGAWHSHDDLDKLVAGLEAAAK